MLDFPLYQITALIFWAVGLAVLYWVIRLAVRHAITDADKRRQGPAALTRRSGTRPE